MIDAFEFLAETIAAQGGSEDLVRRATIVLDEVCSNMIRHDDSLTDASLFTVEVVLDGAAVTMVISDRGRAFDPLAHSQDSSPENGGHGIALIKGLASAVAYRRVKSCNRLTVTVTPGDD